ncbi:hypothetical protein SUDANB145_07156 (plasmid) [Streptomyces sp. enrichment culture]|uniref:hypothetical protein n=1 Tax=Streptomyces sp. enrichment culture TaxID=1795815 RepID=UPI003F562D46
MTPDQAAWVRQHVLAPRDIPPADSECPCQGRSNACEHGRHDDCGHDQWVAWGGYEAETVIGRGYGPFPCEGAFGLDRGTATVYLADRQCRHRCNCHCHQPVPQATAVPRQLEQLDLFPTSKTGRCSA